MTIKFFMETEKYLTYKSWPKIELHVHLDCSLHFDVIRKYRPEVTRDVYNQEYVAPDRCLDLPDLFRSVNNSIELMQTPEQLRASIEYLFRQFQKDGVIYAEIRFAPHLHTERGLSPSRVVEIAESAVEEQVSKTGIEAGLLLCTLRQYSEKMSMETVQLVYEFRNSFVAGFDIAGDEAAYPIDEHKKAFQFAIEKGIPRTAHAGEAAGPESVLETLNHFQPTRIGHGVRSVDSPEVIEILVEKNIHLEVCPSCNIQIGLFERYDNHPVNKLKMSGVSTGINTDGRTTTNITLGSEYEKLSTAFGWTKPDFFQVNMNALEAAFVSDSKKDHLKRQLNDYYDCE